MKYDYQTSLSKTLTTNKIRKHYIIASTIKTNYQNIATGYIYDKITLPNIAITTCIMCLSSLQLHLRIVWK
jgi:hypothetical protein